MTENPNFAPPTGSVPHPGGPAPQQGGVPGAPMQQSPRSQQPQVPQQGAPTASFAPPSRPQGQGVPGQAAPASGPSAAVMPYANAPAPAAYPPFDQTPGRGFAEPAVVTPRPDKVVSEKQAASIPGLLGLLGALVVFFLGVFLATLNPIGVALIVIAALFGTSLTTIQPGDTKVLQFLGNYVGTVRETGLRMTMPFTTKRRVSVKVNNFETREIKVNDADGNPINIAAIVVWQVSDTAEAIFSVENYQQFVTVQSEAALRHIAMSHPYDNSKEGEATLRGATDQIAAELAAEVQARVAIAGIKVIETRISSLAYAPEIAQAMLQRQQAEAVLVARSRIVEGAVTMVESALERLEKDDIVQFDEERKAQMVSNLLVVLCGDSRATPTVPLN